jgi:hypothetical protein
VKIGTRSTSSVRPPLGPPQKKADEIEREFSDTFVENAESMSGRPITQAALNMESSGLSPVTSAFLAVGSVMAPIQALALAGASFAESQPQLASALNEPFVETRQPLRVANSDVPIFSHPQVSAAQATADAVYLNPQFVPHLGQPITDWVVGHELGHIESQDGLAAIGRSFLIGQMKADGLDNKLVASVETLHQELNRQCEFESDREGLEYALQQGHSRETVLAAMAGFLSAMPAGYEASHPDPKVRIENLNKLDS